MSDEEVGYGKPPKSGQFKPGQSGNPSGRPKVHPPFHRIFLDEAHAPISYQSNGKQVEATKAKMIARQVLNKAAKGENPALKLAISQFGKSEAEAIEAVKDKSLMTEGKPKIFSWTEELENLHRMLEDGPIEDEKDEEDDD